MKRADALVVTIEDTDLIPSALRSYEDNAILWASRTVARGRESSSCFAYREDQNRVVRIKAIVDALMMLADPNQEGSDEMLRAIIEERRRWMH
jgi:hypothetical protein